MQIHFIIIIIIVKSHERHGIQNHLQLDCMFNILSRQIANNASKLDIFSPYEGNSKLVIYEFPSRMDSNTLSVSIL